MTTASHPIPSVVLVPTTSNIASYFQRIAASLRSKNINVVMFPTVEECLAGCDRGATEVILTMHTFPMSRDFLKSFPRLRAVMSFITGTEGFDERAATDLGVLVTNGQVPENFNSMAEATIMLMLAAFYDLRGAEAAFRAGTDGSGKERATMLMGKTVGIVGLGKIALAVIDRLGSWGIRILVHVRRPEVRLPQGVTRVDLDDLCKSSDCLVLLANLNSESRHLFDERRLNLIKKGAILINTARGGLVDEEALIRIARSGRFRTLALDTFETEPLPLTNGLRDLPNAILTGHNVGHTVEAHDAMIATAIHNIEQIIRGQLPNNIRNPEATKRWQARWGGA